jgi:hypothetical protein
MVLQAEYTPRHSYLSICEWGLVRSVIFVYTIASLIESALEANGSHTANYRHIVRSLVSNARLPHSPIQEVILRLTTTSPVVNEPLLRETGTVFFLDDMVENTVRTAFPSIFNSNGSSPETHCFHIPNTFNTFSKTLRETLKEKCSPYVAPFIQRNKHLLLTSY